MFGDAERPADHRALRRGVGVRHLADDVRRHAGLGLALRSSVHGSTSARYASKPVVACSMKSRLARPAAMISRAMVFESAMSVPTSRPAHTSAHCAETVRRGSIAIELRPALHALEQVVKEDRVRLPGVRSPQEDAVRFFNLAVRARPTTHAECRRQTGDARGVSRTVAAIEVVRAHHHARELLRGVVHLVRALRAAEQAERLPAMRVADRGETRSPPGRAPRPTSPAEAGRRERHEREDGRCRVIPLMRPL